MLLRSFEDEIVRRVAAGAIANLAMNGNNLIDRGDSFSGVLLLLGWESSIGFQYLVFMLPHVWTTEANQELIMEQGGISLLSLTAADAEDPQTLRMVAGAIANLCGNGMMQISIYAYFSSHL